MYLPNAVLYEVYSGLRRPSVWKLDGLDRYLLDDPLPHSGGSDLAGVYRFGPAIARLKERRNAEPITEPCQYSLFHPAG